jgi:small subunit ribosomal protein S21
LEIRVLDNNVDKALKTLKRKLSRAGLFKELRKRKYFEKPSERRRRKHKEAQRRLRKKLRRQRQLLMQD